MNVVIDNYLRINYQDMIMVLISTFLIVLIAKKYFWNILKEYLANRAAHIQTQIDQSESKLKESELLKEEYEAKLASAKGEAKTIVENATQHAKQEASTIIDTAKTQANALKEKAEKEIEHEKTKVKDEIKQQISEVAFMAAQKVVEKELDASTYKKYVDDFITKAGDE